MKKYKISDEKFLNQVKQWIEADNEIYVDIGFARAGGWNQVFLVNSYEQFLEILSITKNRIGGIDVMRHPKFILRGIANDELFQKAIQSIPEGMDWWLVYRDHDDIFASHATGDNTHQNLKEEFEKHNDKEIALGFDKDFPPFWPLIQDDNFLEASFGR